MIQIDVDCLFNDESLNIFEVIIGDGVIDLVMFDDNGGVFFLLKRRRGKDKVVSLDRRLKEVLNKLGKVVDKIKIKDGVQYVLKFLNMSKMNKIVCLEKGGKIIVLILLVVDVVDIIQLLNILQLLLFFVFVGLIVLLKIGFVDLGKLI